MAVESADNRGAFAAANDSYDADPNGRRRSSREPLRRKARRPPRDPAADDRQPIPQHPPNLIPRSLRVTRRERAAALAQWVVLGSLVGVLCGAGVGAVPVAARARDRVPDAATRSSSTRCPIAGLVIGWIYERFGQSIKAGNNLVIDTIHDEGPEIPLRMAPMVLVGTVLTHLFGGSAGREGTAVQMGASFADWVSHRLRVGKHGAPAAARGGSRRRLRLGLRHADRGRGLRPRVHRARARIEYDALVPALVASVVGDMTTRALGHRAYALSAAPHVRAHARSCLLKWLRVRVRRGARERRRSSSSRTSIKKQSEKRIPPLADAHVRSAASSWSACGSSSGPATISASACRRSCASFSDPQLPAYAFALKLLFTAVTLGAGFLGGEVTPLFFVGAALGSVLARLLGFPSSSAPASAWPPCSRPRPTRRSRCRSWRSSCSARRVSARRHRLRARRTSCPATAASTLRSAC